ncbi:hypothetical protein BS50DRAFT_241364 [Corynespora cassiicola Philippines]|uniref:RRM domain-containing protein n=1 Tax=Corynespora cassiicola Philippines TaxID=1448308 RepID=A0A2T2P2V1_CORCC|nr:hypothetical protein BS50DRAFT_241364 [Corynespora cassiicola Philippines]
MPAARAATHDLKAGPTPSATPTKASPTPASALQSGDANAYVRLHITPFNPNLLKVYLAPSVQPLAKNVSYHIVETFPEKGFGYVELPEMEAQKLKKKLNGTTVKGSKVRIENAKPEKRKAGDDAKENEDTDRSVKRAKKEKKKKEQGVLEGMELPDDRKVKRGWTEPPVKNKKEKKEKEKKDKDKSEKKKQKESKYTKEPELLFKAKLTPVAATDVALKDKKKDKKKEKKDKSKKEVVVHEFEKNTKHASFLKESKVSTQKKPAVDYVDGKGWVDEDGNVVEAETGKARNRRVLELVDTAPVQAKIEKKPSATPSPKSSPAPKTKPAKKSKSKKATPPPSSSSESESESEESSVVSSSSEDELESESEPESSAESTVSTPAKASTPKAELTTPAPETKEVHPLEALFKRPKPSLSTPSSNPTSTPVKGGLAPINTSFSFFDNNNNDAMDVDQEGSENAPVTPYTQRDLEWRGLRSAAPTPDTGAIGRRFSFPWRNGSQEIDDDDDDDLEAGKQLSNNTKANAATAHLPGLAEENEEDAEAGAEKNAADEEGEGEESEWRKWFYENRGDINRKWKKRRRDALKAKRYDENKKLTGSKRVR